MSAFWNHSSQGAIVHGLPFMFCSNKVQVIAMSTGFIFGALPDMLKAISPKLGESTHTGKINKYLWWIPAWGFHTRLIDRLLHGLPEDHWFRRNIEWLFGMITIFVIIYFIKLF